MKKNAVTLTLFTAVILALFFRLFNLGSLITPYWEEVALGYDAYSIVQTGADHHGTPFPVVAFESFGDWKPSGYFYAAAAAVKFFGLSVFSIRLPSALAGVSSVIGIYFLTRLILAHFAPIMPVNQQKYTAVYAVLAATISPWLLLFSRGAWEVNLATAFFLWALIMYLAFARKRTWMFLISSILLFSASAYTYHATRLIAPLVLACLLLWSFAPKCLVFIQSKKKTLGNFPIAELLAGIFFVLLLYPLLASIGDPKVSQRFAETSIFSNVDIIIESNERIEAANIPFSNLFFHRYVLFGQEIISQALSHFTLDFLFIHGDNNKRHATGFIGQFYYIDILFLLMGVYAVTKRYKKLGLFLLLWVGIGLIPASISKANPHALRTLPIAPVGMFIIGLGASELFFWVKSRFAGWQQYIIFLSIVGIYLISFGAFWRYYVKVYPIESAREWQYGYEEMVRQAQARTLEGSNVAISRVYGRPAMYYFFYNQVDPKRVQAQSEIVKKDQSELVQFETITFFSDIEEALSSDIIFIAPSQVESLREKTNNAIQELSRKTLPSGEVIWIEYAQN